MRAMAEAHPVAAPGEEQSGRALIANSSVANSEIGDAEDSAEEEGESGVLLDEERKGEGGFRRRRWKAAENLRTPNAGAAMCN